MSDLRRMVTPLTRGIIWAPRNSHDATSAVYQEIDYLLDGLLTANLRTDEIPKSTRVLLGNNFGNLIYVLLVNDLEKTEIGSFISLLKPSLLPGNDVLVIDEKKYLPQLQKELDEIKNHIRTL
jgi:hypothetical protein